MSPSDPPKATERPSSPPETFGQYLVRERELRGFSLAQIADQTRIGQGNLRALEQDDLSRLPARVFVLGYIKAYAHAIGLNPDEAVLRYEEHAQKLAPPEEGQVLRRSRKGRLLLLGGAVVAVGLGVGLFLLLRG